MKNNINLAGLSEFVNEIKEHKSQSKISYGVDVNWTTGTQLTAKMKNIQLGDQKLVRNFSFDIDEPGQLLGLNTNPTPAEYLMGGIASCMAVTFVAGASLMGISLESLQIQLNGELDLCGFLGIDTNEATGFEKFDCNIIVDGDGTEEQYEILRKKVMKHSPNYSTMVNAVTITPRITKL